MQKSIIKYFGAMFLTFFVLLDLFTIVIFTGDELPERIDNYFINILIEPSILLSSPYLIVLVGAIICASTIILPKIINPKILVLFAWLGVICIIGLVAVHLIGL